MELDDQNFNWLKKKENDKDLTDTLKEMGKVLKDNGHIIANFPQEPRKHKDIQRKNTHLKYPIAIY